MSKVHLHLGDPDLRLGGLQIWVLGRQFPDSDDYWDGNWLNIHARVQASGAVVEVQGPWLRNSEIAGFAEDLEHVYRELRGDAELKCIEPALWAKVTYLSLGHIEMTIKITPDQPTQDHKFIFEMDQSYLPAVLSDCQKLLDRYPIKDPPG